MLSAVLNATVFKVLGATGYDYSGNFCPEFFGQPLFPTDRAQMLNAVAMMICPQKQKIYKIYTKKVKKTRSHPCCLRFLVLLSLKCWAQLAIIIQTFFCPEFFGQSLFPTDRAQMCNAAAMVICPHKQKTYTIYKKKVKKTRSHPCCLRFWLLLSLKCWA